MPSSGGKACANQRWGGAGSRLDADVVKRVGGEGLNGAARAWRPGGGPGLREWGWGVRVSHHGSTRAWKRVSPPSPRPAR